MLYESSLFISITNTILKLIIPEKMALYCNIVIYNTYIKCYESSWIITESLTSVRPRYFYTKKVDSEKQCYVLISREFQLLRHISS